MNLDLSETQSSEVFRIVQMMLDSVAEVHDEEGNTTTHFATFVVSVRCDPKDEAKIARRQALMRQVAEEMYPILQDRTGVKILRPEVDMMPEVAHRVWSMMGDLQSGAHHMAPSIIADRTMSAESMPVGSSVARLIFGVLVDHDSKQLEYTLWLQRGVKQEDGSFLGEDTEVVKL